MRHLLKRPIFQLLLLLQLACAGCRKPAAPAVPAGPEFPPMAALGPSDWPHWRGPGRDDVSRETGLLKSWPEGGPKLLWLSREVGIGYAGPAIVGGRLFTAGGENKKELLLCLDAATGKRIWSAPIGDFYKNDMGSGPRATPSVDGDRVYVMGGNGDLICAAAGDGKIAWQRSLKELGGETPRWGYSESVLIDGDRLLCTPGGASGTMAALDKQTGRTLWQSKEIDDVAHYSSVSPLDVNGERQYVQLTKTHVFGVAVKDGKLLWKVDFPGVTVIPTPIVQAPYVYVTAGQGAGCLLLKVGAGNAAEVVYQNKVMKNQHGGVILVDGYLYGHSDPNGWVCQNFLTGTQAWAERNRLGKGSATCAEGLLYCLEETKGDVVLAEASPKAWHEVSRFKLTPQSAQRSPQGLLWTHPVVSNGRLYLRDQELQFCYDVRAH
ncbi:MAG TPA: PQQ-binding-like beta-propeller repeat protein [Chthoniobacteraceae bacterium]|jgi:hypothetical protein|nr:PQQ-binding-like beta-propeller repeat protein [Chthoniobacteraceae bacterium]